MVMIDLGDEKKSLGVISVTRVTESSRSCAAARADFRAYLQVKPHDVYVSLVWGLRELAAVKKCNGPAGDWRELAGGASWQAT